MKGGIYSDERCPVCGSVFRDDGRTGLYCPEHPKCKADRVKVIFGNLTKRFRSYDAAYRFLTGLRFKTDERTFDERDYRRDNPLGFQNMASRYVAHKTNEVRPGSIKNIRRHLELANAYFGLLNVKEVKFGQLEDFLQTITLSDKTKHGVISTIRSFYIWMKRRQEIRELPDFPVVSFELGYRKTVDKATQQAIIAEVERICPTPKITFAIRLLATYISVRPKEMIGIKEGDIDLTGGYLYFPRPKEKKYKSVPLLPQDCETFKSFGLTFPALHFFRHGTDNQPFGHNLLYNWWVKACRNLGVEGVDLYGGTRHSSVRALRSRYSPEEIKQAAMSATNQAFDRYLGKAEDGQILSIYKETAQVIPIDKGLTSRKTG